MGSPGDQSESSIAVYLSISLPGPEEIDRYTDRQTAILDYIVIILNFYLELWG